MLGTPRTRTDTVNSATTYAYLGIDRIVGNAQNPFAVQSHSSVGVYSTLRKYTWRMEDYVTQNYRKLRNQGIIVNNPLYMKSTWLVESPPMLYKRGKLSLIGGYPNGYRFEGVVGPAGSVGPFLSPLNDPTTDVYEKAVTAAFARANAAETLLLATIGEFHETVDLLVSLLRRAGKLLLKIKSAEALLDLNNRGVGKFAKRGTRKIRAQWLEYRYGLRPLILEIDNTIKAFNSSVGTSKRATFRSLEKYEREISDTHATSPEYDTLRKSRVTITARAGVLADVEFSYLNVWGVDQLLDSAWELIPFSFIVDWFFNVGKVVASWSPDYGVRVLASWCVVERTTIQFNELANFRNSGGTFDVEDYWDWGGSVANTVFERWRVVDPKKPVFPHYSLRINPAKILDLLAIISQLRR